MVEQLSVSPNIPMAALLVAFGTDIEVGKNLAPLTSYRTGGKAKYFVSADSADQIVRAVRAARRLKLPFFLIGGGSNLLVSDNGFDGLIIKVDVRGLVVKGQDSIRSGAGEELMSLVDFATENSLSGLEFAAGIRGSVGGAIYGNAGAFGGEIGSVVTELALVDREGEIKTVEPDYCRFQYRDSYLKSSGEIVIEAEFQLQRGNQADITEKVQQILAHREAKHPHGGMSAGCFFKNIPDSTQPHGKLAAGKLLEEAGAKELCVGGARVYDQHANIIVNTGNATSKDIRQLADIMKQRVREKFGIELEEEVIQIGTF